VQFLEYFRKLTLRVTLLAVTTVKGDSVLANRVRLERRPRIRISNKNVWIAHMELSCLGHFATLASVANHWIQTDPLHNRR
jgi:hypothetical protein